MGYRDIITDTNDLVLQGQFLLCYPPGSTFDYDIDIIFDKVNCLYKLGYRLNIPLFSEIILLFIKFIDSIGNDILQICSKLMNRTAEDVLLDFLRLSMFSEQDFTSAHNFYISKYVYVKEAFMNSLRQHLCFLFQKLENILRSTYEMRDINIQLKEILPFKKNFLKWILTTYNTTSNVVNGYFNFILHLRVIISIFEGSFANGMPLGFSIQDIEMIKELFHHFVHSGCIFKKEHLDIIQLCNDEDILNLFFDHFIVGTTQSQKEWLDTLSCFECKKYTLGNFEFDTSINFIIKLSDFNDNK